MLPRLLRDDGRVGRPWTRVRATQASLGGRSTSATGSLVSGEPGIGKTRLAARVATRPRGNGMVLYGRCDEHLGLPYRPWIDVLGQYVERRRAIDDRGACREYGGEVARLAPTSPAAYGAGQPAGEPAGDRAIPAIRGGWAAPRGGGTAAPADRSRRSPLGGQGTLALLRHVMSSGEPPRALVRTFRDSEVTAGGALNDALAALHREPGVERISLGGLEVSEVVALVEMRRP